MDLFSIFYDYVRCGLWASSGPFPLSAHEGLYKRGRDPPTNPSHHLKKERSVLPLKWLLKEDQGRRPTAASAAATATAPLRAAAETAASPYLVRYYQRAAFLPLPPPPQVAARSQHRHPRRSFPPQAPFPPFSPPRTSTPSLSLPLSVNPCLHLLPVLGSHPPHQRVSPPPSSFHASPIHRRPLLLLPNLIRDLPLNS